MSGARRLLLRQVLDRDGVREVTAELGAVAGYFISPAALAARRRHVVNVASMLEKWSRT